LNTSYNITTYNVIISYYV